MTELTASAVLVALMQTATSLPVFLVGLPAGAIADVVDRRKLLLVSQAWMLVVATLLGVLTVLNLTTEWVLLALTFLLGLGAAFNAPAGRRSCPSLWARGKSLQPLLSIARGSTWPGRSAPRWAAW